MASLRSALATLGFGCFVVGLVASLSGGGTIREVTALGNSLVTAGAILIAAVLVSAAVADSGRKE